MSDDTKAPAPFDPAHWISIPDAVALVREVRPGTRDTAIRKLLLGALIHGYDSRLDAIAMEYREGFDRFERDPVIGYRGPAETEHEICRRFWRIGMAWDQYADHAFATGDFHFEGTVYQSELPYRMRDRDNDLGDERVLLFQSARGVRVDRRTLEKIVRDRQWRQWGEIFDAVNNKGRRGKAPKWQWDEVAAALAMEASSNPEILRNGPGPIIRFINSEMRQMNFDDVPDPADASRFAQLFWKMWAPEGSKPPPP